MATEAVLEAELDAGIPAIPARGERTELDRLPDLLREQVADLSAMAFELGEDNVTNGKEQNAEGRDRGHEHAAAEAQDRARQRFRGAGGVGAGARQRHDRLGRVILPLEPQAAPVLPPWTWMQRSSSAATP